MDPKQAVKRVNIIIPKRDRHEFLATCLHYLNLACANPGFKVTVYVSDDSVNETPPLGHYKNFKLMHLRFPNSGLFNKSRLINNALSRMDDFDWFSILDVDMVYTHSFLNDILRKINLGADYVVSHGYKLGSSVSGHVMASYPAIEYVMSATDKEEFRVGPSQISMTKAAYNLFISSFGSPLYDEFYEGWGAEDSDVSFKSMFLSDKRMLRKESVNDVWYHMYHESRNTNGAQYKRNYDHFIARLADTFKTMPTIQGGTRA